MFTFYNCECFKSKHLHCWITKGLRPITPVFYVCLRPSTPVFYVCLRPITPVFYTCLRPITQVFYVQLSNMALIKNIFYSLKSVFLACYAVIVFCILRYLETMVGFYIYNVFHFILVDYSVYWPCHGSKK
jgi:hypothetical protein